MSDEPMPAWAQAMENRLGAKIESGQQALKDLELKLGAKIDAGEHALLREAARPSTTAKRAWNSASQACGPR